MPRGPREEQATLRDAKLAQARRARSRRIWPEPGRHGTWAPLFATFCATSATASFMAYDFHELSPYVLIGNPLTLAMIELFAVPARLLGSLLYPSVSTASSGPISARASPSIMTVARWIGSAPGASSLAGFRALVDRLA